LISRNCDGSGMMRRNCRITPLAVTIFLWPGEANPKTSNRLR
jgi:hypothetical protein